MIYLKNVKEAVEAYRRLVRVWNNEDETAMDTALSAPDTSSKSEQDAERSR